jgi:hypothetical protein
MRRNLLHRSYRRTGNHSGCSVPRRSSASIHTKPLIWVQRLESGSDTLRRFWPFYHDCITRKKMSIREELLQLRKERSERAPFSTLLDFEDWADSVLPLLSFHEPTERELSQILTWAGMTYRMGSHEDTNTNMNMAIGVLNQAIKRAEIEKNSNALPQIGFESLLHPVIVESSLSLYTSGHLRESVLNAITAVFDLIRKRTGVDDDGDRLIG